MPLLAEGAFMHNVLDYLYEAEATYTNATLEKGLPGEDLFFGV